jgi:hypothetical protein
MTVDSVRATLFGFCLMQTLARVAKYNRERNAANYFADDMESQT